jgi:hypothetical protein
MTGLKYEDEAKEVANLLINIINNINVPIKTNIESLKNIDKTYDFQLIYDPKTNNVFYYRKYYDRFLTPYMFDTDIIYTTNISVSSELENLDQVVPRTQKRKNSDNGGDKGLTQVNYNRKGFRCNFAANLHTHSLDPPIIFNRAECEYTVCTRSHGYSDILPFSINALL